MASTREIKRRVRGINNIKQITNAMELVSTAKLRRARIQLEKSRDYYETVLDDIHDLLTIVGEDHPLLQVREVENVLYIVLTSDRGLAGGYNSNIIKLTEDTMAKNDGGNKLLVVGTKAKDYFARRNYDIANAYVGISERPSFQHAKALGREAMDLYLSGEVDAIDLVFTRFESTLKNTPKVMRLLPSKEINEIEKGPQTLVAFEPSSDEVLNYLIPKYIEISIFGGLIEAAAAEQGARRVSMQAATDNANDMIEALDTEYNRARQAAITSEISEIVSAADALK